MTLRFAALLSAIVTLNDVPDYAVSEAIPGGSGDQISRYRASELEKRRDRRIDCIHQPIRIEDPKSGGVL